MNIRYSEIFYSFQGEAEMTGQPAAWIRLFGCNLNCSGFGQTNPTDPSTYELPYQQFDPTVVKRVEDLPVWNKGCDSSYSWSAKFRHLAHVNTEQEIADKLTDLLKHPSNPDGLFWHPRTKQPVMLSITGGEPMLQQKAIIAVLEEFESRMNTPPIVNIETNTTQPLRDELRNYIFATQHSIRWHFSMSPKLFTVSGEQGVLDPRRIYEYVQHSHTSVLKFVHTGTEACWNELENTLDEWRKVFAQGNRPLPSVWIMPVGATKDDQEQQWVADLAIEAMKRGYNVAARVQCYVFGNIIGR